jgi:hypothetical protein
LTQDETEDALIRRVASLRQDHIWLWMSQMVVQAPDSGTAPGTGNAGRPAEAVGENANARATLPAGAQSETMGAA